MKERPKDGSLRVWWIPQVPMRTFYVSVPSLESADMVLSLLANYDKFQFENRIKPDYCNAGGLELFAAADIVDGDPETGWTDWYSDDNDDFDSFRANLHLLAMSTTE